MVVPETSTNSPRFRTQHQEITNLLNKCPRRGEIWYLVSSVWFKKWKKYANRGGEASRKSTKVLSFHPGPIDNSDLLKEDGSGDIKENLIEKQDYFLLPKQGWEMLSECYGLTAGQEGIARNVVESGVFVRTAKVEVYLTKFMLRCFDRMESTVTCKFSRTKTIGYIEQQMRRVFNIPPTCETRVWHSNQNKYLLLDNREHMVQEIGLSPDQNTIDLVIEFRNAGGSWSWDPWPTGKSNARANESRSFSAAGDSRQTRNSDPIIALPEPPCSTHSNVDQNSAVRTFTPGLCGLMNVGNTCFLNAALQCLSNTPPLTDYFLRGSYWNDLNTENPLGTKGEIAKAYGSLMKRMWSGYIERLNPKMFREVVGHFGPQFARYIQQDTQELLAFLLDRLHEDLNKVTEKPYSQHEDRGGSVDEILAAEAWTSYLERNKSVIVDIFHGLLKSTLVCPQCSGVSVTFDPFCYLSLPLPVPKEIQQSVRFVGIDHSKRPLDMKVTVPKYGCISDLCNAVSRLTGASAKNLIVADIFHNYVFKVFLPTECVAIINQENDKIFAYEVQVEEDGEENWLLLPVYFKEKQADEGTNYGAKMKIISHPLFLKFPSKGCTYSDVYRIILSHMKRFVRHLGTETPGCAERKEMVEASEHCQTQQSEDASSGGCQTSDEIIAQANDEDTTLFTVLSVNREGRGKVLPKDGSLISLSKNTFLAAEFDPDVKAKYIDHQEATTVDLHESWNAIPTQKKPPTQLGECLQMFTAEEKLGEVDSWYCSTCMMQREASKKIDLWQLPQVLVIHLKRFSYNRNWREKLDVLVQFPVSSLDMADFVINPSHGQAVYDLIAVANHVGGMGGGHYTAYAKNQKLGSWFYFNDGNVTRCSESDVVSQAAYVLFYMRKDSKPPRHCLRSPEESDHISPLDEDCDMENAALLEEDVKTDRTSLSDEDTNKDQNNVYDEDCHMDTSYSYVN